MSDKDGVTNLPGDASCDLITKKQHSNVMIVCHKISPFENKNENPILLLAIFFNVIRPGVVLLYILPVARNSGIGIFIQVGFEGLFENKLLAKFRS